jgi:hypothetical protein
MIETITIITLSLLFLAFVRPGKTPPLTSPLTINRIGQYHALLAPMINLAQPFLESISAQLNEHDRRGGNIRPLYFAVQDKAVKAHGADLYLLAASLLDGVLYFQATVAKDNENHIDTIRAFSDEDLKRHPTSQSTLETDEVFLVNAVQAAANLRGILITQIIL